MLWKGPKDDGITQSILNRFMGDDPFRNYLYFGLGLEEYQETEPNLAYGDTGHYGLEHLIELPYTKDNFTPEDWESIFEAMEHKLNNEYPESPPSFLHSLKQMIPLYDDSFKDTYGRFITELDFAVPYTTKNGRTITLRGKVDALNIVPGQYISTQCNFGARELAKIPEGFVPGPIIGEHKFKGRIKPAQTLLEVPVDLQVCMYCYATGAKSVIYDEIRIPDTQYSLPPKRQNQKLASWIKELYYDKQWGDFPISVKRNKWISQNEIPITEENILHVFDTTLDPLVDNIYEWYDHCSQPGFDPYDPKYYNSVFWRKPPRTFDATKTQSYLCNYHGLLTNQIGHEDLVPVPGFYQELPT